MSDKFVKEAADFLTYVAYRGTKYFKIFGLIKAFTEQTVAEQEAKLLQLIGVDGFKALINKPKYLELLDAVVKQAYPDAELPERKLFEHEQKLNQEILNLQGAIRRGEEERFQLSEEVASQKRNLATRESDLFAQIKSEQKKMEEAKRKLDEEVKKLEVVTSKLAMKEEE